MNPILLSALGSILRWLFAIGAGYLVQRGIWTDADATAYVSAAALGLLSLAWSLYNKYRGRVKFLTALDMPVGATEAEVKTKVDAGLGASIMGTGDGR